MNRPTEVNISSPNPTLSSTDKGNINIYQKTPGTPPTKFEALVQRVSVEALHSSREVPDSPICRPRNPVVLLDNIYQWANASESASRIKWICGSGKSTLLRTLAEMLEQHRLLLASFSFSGAAALRNNADCFIPTIAYQISHSIPTTRSHIERAIGNDPLIFSKSLTAQAQVLIVDPITQAHQENRTGKRYPRIIMVDGLNDCEGEATQKRVLRVLKMISKAKTIAFLVASRPEPHILAFFDSELNKISTRLVLEESDGDDGDIPTDDEICEICEHQHPVHSEMTVPKEETQWEPTKPAARVLVDHLPYTVPFFWGSFTGRQLAAVGSESKKEELIMFMLENNGNLEVDWYEFCVESDFHKAIIKTRDLGGIVYDLPIKYGM